MTSPAFNRRKAGKYADWQSFGIGLARRIREQTGPDYPIMYRIDLSMALNETYGCRVESVRGFQNGRAAGSRRFPET